VDKSFEGLLASLALHAALVLLLWRMPFTPAPAMDDRTEVTLLEKTPEPSKVKAFVTETEKQADQVEDLSDSADLLSQLTKRVKKQMRARLNGPTRNSRLRLAPQLNTHEEKPRGVAGNEPATPREDGVGLPAPGGGQSLRTVAIGPSSIAEFIPSVQEGAFTALNTDQFTYYSFFSRINEQVRNRWIDNIRAYVGNLSQKDLEILSTRDRQTVIEIILDRKGEFTSAVLQNSSGDRALDQTTVAAFRAAAPFLNPPRGMIEDDGHIHLHYGFVVRFRPSFGQAGFQ
jgi:protein TonB